MLLISNIRNALAKFCRCGIDEGLDTTAYIQRIERHFNILLEIPVVQSIKTLGDVCDQIARLRGATTVERESDIWIEVRRITSEEMGVEASELQKGTRFIEDLCC